MTNLMEEKSAHLTLGHRSGYKVTNENVPHGSMKRITNTTICFSVRRHSRMQDLIQYLPPAQ